MSNIKELTHALSIVQKKLNACQAQKAELLNKMSTKRTLLHESRQTLQNQYANSLTQENKASQITENDYNSNQLEMIPIIGGWVRSGRIWIQVAAKLNCIQQQQIQLSCFPVMYIPETVSLNKYANVQPDQIIHLYYAFDLLPDILFDQLKLDLKVYCLANQVWEISWKLDDDVTWTKQLSISNHRVIQAYFPHHLRINITSDIQASINVPCTKYNQLLVATDQSFVVLLGTEYFDLYGLSPSTVSNIAQSFDELTLTSSNRQDLIKLLGDAYVTLEHNELNHTRVNISTILSQF
ncbi:hypothetical protein HPULCUR_011928 [Helicostylum pulchrum]|uniref:Uncharacterized protein n=1 Tax=Helicostylum pulchrum TaxID=562976 RepID=A0ABP9YHG4_9FUNG